MSTLASGFPPCDPARFSTKGPLRPMTIEVARRIARALDADGGAASEVRRVLKAYGFYARPLLKIIEGGTGKSDG